ncbi:MAG: four-carbon acid sugar kinase family protein [Cyanobacteria bacterium J06642_11]
MSSKIIVLDDDPTGSQTVHSCLLLLQWDVETLKKGLEDASPIFFILTNTRALPPDQARQVVRDVCQNLKQALDQVGITNFLVVSRSDSTLRGHYPIETDEINRQLGPFDAHFMVPAFFEAQRVTMGGIHYIMEGDRSIPVHTTEFAQDSTFGFSHSYLPDYVNEKNQGRISSEQVVHVTLSDVRRGTEATLLALENNVCVCVDAEQQSDLDCFARDILAAVSQGKRFLFRSAASLLTSLAHLPPQPIKAQGMHQYTQNSGPGMVLVGSHVQKTTQQLNEFLKLKNIVGIEVDVAQLRETPDQGNTLRQEISDKIHHLVRHDYIPVVYTSRQELPFDDGTEQLAFGSKVSGFLMSIVHHLPKDLRFLIAKGGITSNDTLSQGLRLTTARLLGQIAPGVSVVKTEANHPQFPDLPVVLFPGNVGDEDGVVLAYQRLVS